jgi:hypothetical protein
MAFNTTINQLTGTSTFYDWFIKENSEIIAKLNQATVSGVTSGDGVLVSLNAVSGLATLSIGGTSGNITTGLTFSGDVTFLGDVVVPNNSFKVTGITSGSPGYSFGSVVRVTSTGYTLARADNPDSAEVVGVISSLETAYSIVTLTGRINGNFTSVAGGTLSPGCVYFLSPSAAGQITTTEPSTIGYVSKPVILGLGQTAGVVLQYRGNYLNGSAGGSSGGNKIYFTLPSSSNAGSYGFSAGYFLSYAQDQLTGNTFMHQYLVDTGRTAINGWFLSAANDLAYPFGTGVYGAMPGEEEFIVGMVESVTVSGSDLIYEVIAEGQTTVVPYSITSYPSSKVGTWFVSGTTFAISPAGITQIVPTVIGDYNPGTRVGMVFDNSAPNWYVSVKKAEIRTAGTPVSLRNGTFTYLSNQTNYAHNGDFSIWQRSTARDSAYTSSTNTYFADGWIMRQSGIDTGSVQSLQRQSFTATSTDVEGNPDYYVNVKCVAAPGGADPEGGEHTIGHVIEDVNKFNGSNVTISFYSKCALANYSVNVYFARYSAGSQISKSLVGTVDLTTSWAKYTLNYEIPDLTASPPFSDDYVEIGIDLIPSIQKAYDLSLSTGTNVTVSLTSFNVFDGAYTNPTHNFEKYEEKLKKAQRFYYSTYDADETIGTKTMLANEEPVLNTYTFTYLPNSPFSILKFPVTMREDPTVAVYSPNTGLTPEMYNYTARKDLRYSGRSTGYGGAMRVPVLGTPSVTTTQDTSSVKINIGAGAVPYDVMNCHVVADASYPI